MLMNDQLRARVVRLLGQNEPQVADLDRLYILLRARHHSRPRFHDLGNFAAHGDRRDQGLSFQIANDMARALRFFMPRVWGHPIDLSPADLQAVLNANYRLCGEERMIEALSLRRDVLRSVFGQLVRQADGHKNGEIIWRRRLTERERKVADYLTVTLSMHCIFDEETIVEDFIHVLMREKLLRPEEAHSIRRRSGFLALHAAAMMHCAQIVLTDGTLVNLTIAPGSKDKSLVVCALVPIPLGDGNEVVIGHTILTIEQSPSDRVADYERWIENSDAPLELRSDGKLHLIG